MVTNRYADKLPPSALGKAVKIARDEATKQSEKLMQDEITDSLVDDFGYTPLPGHGGIQGHSFQNNRTHRSGATAGTRPHARTGNQRKK